MVTRLWLRAGCANMAETHVQSQRDMKVSATRRSSQRSVRPPILRSSSLDFRSTETSYFIHTYMKAFADLYTLLDETTKTSAKVRALKEYFAHVPAEDAAWAVYFLIGRKPRQVIRSGNLRTWAALAAGVPPWLFQESYDAVGDVAETIVLLLPPPERSSNFPLSYWIEKRLLPLRSQSEENQRVAMLEAWRELNQHQRFVWNKLISGGFRVGVSQQLVTRALAEVGGIKPAVVAHRLMGDWEPSPSFFTQLLAHDPGDADSSRPYPFFLAYALDQPAASLGDRSQWQAEWKWDGIRCQLIRRSG